MATGIEISQRKYRKEREREREREKGSEVLFKLELIAFLQGQLTDSQGTWDTRGTKQDREREAEGHKNQLNDNNTYTYVPYACLYTRNVSTPFYDNARGG